MEVEQVFNGYDEATWEKTAFFYESKGYLVTSRQRIFRSRINKNETEKYVKEKQMCLRYAGFGFRIEHLSEFPGKSSPDVNIVHIPHNSGVAIINGKTAELKSLRGANNIIKRAKYSVFRQGAELVLFEFPSRNRVIDNTICSLSNLGIHGYYYYADEVGYQSF